MTCGACEKRLSEFGGGELDAKTAAAVREHLDVCRACARIFEETLATVRLLRRAGESRPPSEFSLSLHRRLVAAGPPAPIGLFERLRHRFALRPMYWAIGGAAVAAVVAAGAGRLRFFASTVNAPVAEITAGLVTPTFRVPGSRLAVVKIDFVAEQPVEDVAFAVALPEGLHFVSGGKELPDREFRWRGPLVEGSNSIPFAVRGTRAGRYTIQARAVGNGVDASHEVVLEVTKG